MLALTVAQTAVPTNEALRLTSSAVAMKAVTAEVMNDRFGQDAARGVAGAYEQYVVVTLHDEAPFKSVATRTNACCR